MIFDIPVNAVLWLLNGERGISSEAIFSHLTGLPLSNTSWSKRPPVDPADLGRCRALLAVVPEFAARLGEMASLPGWDRLVPEWDRLCALMDEELADGGDRAPKTYGAMQALGL